MIYAIGLKTIYFIIYQKVPVYQNISSVIAYQLTSIALSGTSFQGVKLGCINFLRGKLKKKSKS